MQVQQGLIRRNKAYNCWGTHLSRQTNKSFTTCCNEKFKEKLENLGESSGENEAISKLAQHEGRRNNTKGFECCKNVLQLARYGQISLLRLNALELQKYTEMMEAGKCWLWRSCFNGEKTMRKVDCTISFYGKTIPGVISICIGCVLMNKARGVFIGKHVVNKT